jgi:hypothetical protein
MEQFEDGGAFTESLDEVAALLSVNTNNSHKHPCENKGNEIARGIGKDRDSSSGSSESCNSNSSSSCSSYSTLPTVSASASGSAKSSDFEANLNNELLWQGAQAIGFKAEKIPRNVKGVV